ncbi:uncharacterized protein PV09_05021 [Verruconis gallopava]|uniref:Uncharacterized protein n=1 Tax=Verruconis gallopava TaxID=253628 RepID=A0A0D2AAB5_9PEZI|nr:uncharacterized protein PV09_05021 [Verruconis gallopava]KIW03708.1 hypothetical protein PV09_05021 [Verruconis gallopava]
MMIQPRAYLYRAPSPEQKDRRRNSVRSQSPRSAPSISSSPTRPRSTPLPEPTKNVKKPEITVVNQKVQVPVVERAASEPVSIPTTSMLVQPRHHPSARSQSPRAPTQTVRSRGPHGGRTGRKVNEKHDANALPPAVAALLAVTTIPPPSRINRRRTPSQQRRISIDELIQEWRQEDNLSSSEGTKTPLDILLEPADETDNEDDQMLAGIDDEKDSACMSSRSVSSDSIASTPSLSPSLDATRSTVSNLSGPNTPSYRNRKHLAIRTEKVVSSPPTESCLDDHPLRSPASTDTLLDTPQIFPQRPKRVVKQKSTFKSNLTASLSALKSAAKSFSNFTAPSIPHDDMLTRSFFSQPYPSEMRPRDIEGIPDPALRRYLNPTHGVPALPVLSSDDFSFQLQEALSQPADDVDDSPLIQMQTYSRRKRSRSRVGLSVGPDRGEAAVLGQSLPWIRQREPRENSDFLRVIVLEMNMRRTGKLDSKGPLRARIWLPPRKNCEGSEVEVRGNKEVPIRWVGLSPDDI